MSEQFNQAAIHENQRNWRDHKKLAKQVAGKEWAAASNHAEIKKLEYSAIERPYELKNLPALQEKAGVKQNEVEAAKEAYNQQIARASEFALEHSDVLIEQAKKDAETQGVQINLGQPKE